MEKYEPYTLEQLIENINNLQESVVFNKEFHDEIILDSDFKFNRLKFKKCNFKNGIKFTEVDLNEELVFEDCIIDNIEFVECKSIFKGFSYLRILNSEVDSLKFETNKIFVTVIEINNTNIKNYCSFSNLNSPNTAVNFSDCSFLNNIIIESCNLHYLTFSYVKITGNLEIHENNNFKGLDIRESHFGKELSFESFNSQKVSIFNCEFNRYVNLDILNISGLLQIVQCKFNEGLNIISERLLFPQKTLKTCYLIGNQYSETFYFKCNFLIIENFYIFLSKYHKGTINVNASFHQIHLEGINTELEINFNRTCTNYLFFNGVKNFKEIKFVELDVFEKQKDSSICILDSTLNNVNFYKIDFSQFKDIEIINSNLTETTFANVTWFKKEQINAESKDYKNTREVFRQLKYSLEKQGNKIDALYFKALEMDVYQKEIKNTEKCQDKLMLLFYSTNDFGLNWVKPVCLLLSGALVFYFLIILSMLPDYSCDNTCKLPALLSENIKTYFLLLDPTHSLEKMYNKCEKDSNTFVIGFWANAFSYILKLYLAFFIFQTIKAFRKFAE